MKSKKEPLKLALVKKKLLWVNKNLENFLKEKTPKFKVKDFLKEVNENPRLLEPGIALLVKYPKVLIDPKNLPKDLQGMIDSLKAGIKEGKDYEHARYKNVLKLCNIQASKDRRLKKSSDLKKMKTFRLSNETIEGLEYLKKKLNLKTQTDVIEYLVVNKV